MTRKSLKKETQFYYHDRKQKKQLLELYTFYLVMGLIAVFIVIVLLLILQFVVNVLCAISMEVVLCLI